ncbi:Morphogenesis-related protein MSB1 [Paramyrothecium foliicola]|nr:Morphogenesis-related protein MSB1 [Paramyrothecium foliicola]
MLASYLGKKRAPLTFLPVWTRTRLKPTDHRQPTTAEYSLFSRLKAKDGSKSRKKDAGQSADLLSSQPKWTDAYARTSVEPEEIHELIHCCTVELKTQALDIPFLLLPFRPTSDPSAVRTFIRHYFQQGQPLRGELLLQELRMTEPMVIAGVLKWCWSRLQGGVVGWDAYDLFKVGEHAGMLTCHKDSNMARDSFKTFIPISVENGARQRIIFDFFDLMAAVAAHGKRNGFGGHKLSRLAAWWAFEHQDTKDGFDGGYKAWVKAADATSHLFFAYLRSLCPEQKVTGITLLPKSLETLLRETPYPPPRRDDLMVRTDKVVMIVDTVSSTPFALLRRAKHFQYRASDRALQEFSEYEDPVQALTEECRRVLKAISGANQSHVSSTKHSTSLRDASWSRFEDIGFSSALDDDDEDDDSPLSRRKPQPQGLRTTPMSGNGLARPTTPSWADFLSTGFVDDHHPDKPNMLLPPDKVLPPIDTETRHHSSQSHRGRLESNKDLEPGELASITSFLLDDAFWWVWMSSLAPEETAERKSAFGRCAVIEANIRSGRWLVMEEMIAGAAPEPQEGAYIAGKKGFFSWTKRSKTVKASKKQGLDSADKNISKASIGPDTHAKVQAKAAQLRAQETLEKQLAAQGTARRGRTDADLMSEKTNSVFTLQPNLVGEASPAMKWAKNYDKSTIKDAYLANTNAGRGLAMSPAPSEAADSFVSTNGARNDYPRSPQGHGIHSSPASPMLSPPPQAVEPMSPVSAMSFQRKEVPPPPPPEHDPEPEEFPDHSSPPPPPKDKALPDIDREGAMTPELSDTSPDGKRGQRKLHKEKGTGGFRKLFGRKNRASKVPDNAAADMRDFLQANPRPSDDAKPREAAVSRSATPQPSAPAPVPVASPVQEESVGEPAPAMPVSPISTTAPADLPAPKPSQSSPQTPRELQIPEGRYERSIDEIPSPIDARDAAEAKAEFSRFDQGPLSDQPAFVPNASDDDDDATPPPIARRPIPVVASRKPLPDKGPEEKLSHSAGPGVQDRWAQIRKNAAERAAQRQQDDFRTVQPKPADGEDDTSGEETIESRVARIKARVAELTGSMEGTSAPGTPPQPIAGRR